jgi:hypothetical protein
MQLKARARMKVLSLERGREGERERAFKPLLNCLLEFFEVAMEPRCSPS